MSGAQDPPGYGGLPHNNGKGKGRAIDFDESHYSQAHGLFCVHCNQRVSDPARCLFDGHYLPELAMIGTDDLLHQNEYFHLCSSGSTHEATGVSGSGPIFSTTHSYGGITTDSTGLHSGDLLYQQQALHDSPLNASCSTSWSPCREQCSFGHTREQAAQDVEMRDVDDPCFNQAQQETLKFWKRRCESERRSPTSREVQSIADLENLSVDDVRSWFATQLIPPPTAGPQSNRFRDRDKDSIVDDTQIQDVASEVRQYAADRNDRPCDNAQSRRAMTGRPFKCTVGCGFSTDRLDQWKRHLRNRYPQRFWHCVLCRGTGRTPFISHRKDKILKHLENVHSEVTPPEYGDIRERSEVRHQGGFPNQCPFENESGVACHQTFESWEEFLEHCLRHLNDETQDGPWQLRFNQRNFEDDDDNGNSGLSNSSSFGIAFTSSSSMAPAQGGAKQSRTASKTTAGPPNRHRPEQAIDSKAVPSSLIDVELYQRVLSPSRNLKFLALDYSWASEKSSQTKRIDYSRSNGDFNDSLIHYDQLPMPFQRAIELTREMGHRYLWIDAICEEMCYEEKRNSVFKQAALIIVIVGFDASPDDIWHFTCDHKNLQTVLNWAEASISTLSFSHVQNLGHGAYGIVDEVRLVSTSQTYARKVCVSRSGGRSMKPRYLQEIEILRRFEHPNIARFVAAYVQRRSLNILMLPVAECDLRELLSDPKHWKSKLPCLLQWFSSLASALEYMHSLSCRHKDIKPANILVSRQDVLLSDFGTSRDFSSSDSDSQGPGFMTPKYCAPEVAQHKRRGRKADIYSLGCVFLEMITVDLGQSLASLNEHLGLRSKSKDLSAVYNQRGTAISTWLQRLQDCQPSRYQEKIIEITARMLNDAPSKRPTAKQVRQLLQSFQLYHAGPVETFDSSTQAMVLYRGHVNQCQTSKTTTRTKTGSRSSGFCGRISRPSGPSTAMLPVPEAGSLISLYVAVSNSRDRLICFSTLYMSEYLSKEQLNGKPTSPPISFGKALDTAPTIIVSQVILIHIESVENLGLVRGHKRAINTKGDVLQELPLATSVEGVRQVLSCQQQRACAEQLPSPLAELSLSRGPFERRDQNSQHILALTQRRRDLAVTDIDSELALDQAVARAPKRHVATLARLAVILAVTFDDSQTKRRVKLCALEEEPSASLAERLASVWNRVVRVLPASKPEGDGQRDCSGPQTDIGDSCLWPRLRNLWMQVDGLLVSYERKLLFALLSQKSRAAVILKRRLATMGMSPISGVGSYVQHKQPAVPHTTLGQPNGDLRRCKSLIETGERVRGMDTIAGSGSQKDEILRQTNCPDVSLDLTSSLGPSRRSTLSSEVCEDVDLTISDRDVAHASNCHDTPLTPTQEPALATDDELLPPPDDLKQHLIEVGDFGFIPLDLIRRSLARHDRCTCHDSEEVDSDADSDTHSVCSSSPLRSVSSSTSLASLATDFESSSQVGFFFPPIFNPLRLTAAVEFELVDFSEFDIW